MAAHTFSQNICGAAYERNVKKSDLNQDLAKTKVLKQWGYSGLRDKKLAKI